MATGALCVRATLRLVINPAVWDDPDMRRALANRDITALFRLLVAAGFPQREIARCTGQSQSNVSEIIHGRRVSSYDLLVRIADGLRIPRGAMGLAYAGVTEPEPEEVDEDVKRRNFINAVAGAVVWGLPIRTELFGPMRPDPPTPLPSRIGMADVEALEATVSRLGVLDREAGGMAARESLAATATAAERLTSVTASREVAERLQGALSEAHRLAGWASGDVGLIDHCRHHMRLAMTHAQGAPERLAGVFAAAGDMEKHFGAPADALKFFTFAKASLPVGADPQAGAVVHGLSASAYLSLGHAEQARSELRTARAMFGDAPDPDASLPFFAFYGPGHGLLAATGAKLADFEPARTDVQAALRARPEYDVRCRALDTIVLATILINAGELAEGVTETRRALDLVTQVGSQRVRDRLKPLERALDGRRNSTCADLARQARTLRAGA